MHHPENDRPEFFKYMTAATARIVLQQATLRWSTAAALNDPFDLNFDLDANIAEASRRSIALEKMWDDIYADTEPPPRPSRLGAMIRALRGKVPPMSRDEFAKQFGPALDEGAARFLAAWPTVSEALRNLVSATKILALTEVPDNRAMWAHYSGGYSGAVLCFVANPDGPWRLARPVTYVDHPPPFIDWSEFMSGRLSFDGPTIMTRMLFTKHREWASEREWRIASGVGRDPTAAFEDIAFRPEELGGLIVGPRITPEDRVSLIEAAAALNTQTKIFEAKKEPGAFGLTIQAL